MDLLLSLSALILAITWALKPARVVAGAKQAGKTRRGVLIVLTIMAGLAGLAFRLYRFSGSLWLDEFGTLWVVEGSVKQAWERALVFQGQSPVFYLLTWLPVHVLGESEIALRLPAFLCGLASVWVLCKLAREAGGPGTGAFAATLAWVSHPMVEASANARPYSLVALAAATMLLGFVRTTRTGAWRARLLFIGGGVVLFYSQYACAVFAAGIAAAYAATKELRKFYRPSQFGFDAGVQLLFAIPCVAQLRHLMLRKSALSWFEAPNYTILFELAGALVVVALAGVLGRKTSRLDGNVSRLLWITMVTPVIVLGALALKGTNLLAPRYLFPIIIPAAVLAADALLALARRQVIPVAAYWLFWSAFFFGAHYVLDGSFNGAGRQDWRGVVSRLNPNGAPVLLRSGFVEDDGWPQGRVNPAALAPLRSPGTAQPAWKIVPLTYRWENIPRRKDYFDEVVAPAVAGAPVFFLLSCQNEVDGYPEHFRKWVGERFQGRFESTPLDLGRGLTVVRFEDRRRALP